MIASIRTCIGVLAWYINERSIGEHLFHAVAASGALFRSERDAVGFERNADRLYTSDELLPDVHAVVALYLQPKHRDLVAEALQMWCPIWRYDRPDVQMSPPMPPPLRFVQLCKEIQRTLLLISPATARGELA